jgi:hypothetical protein
MVCHKETPQRIMELGIEFSYAKKKNQNMP